MVHIHVANNGSWEAALQQEAFESDYYQFTSVFYSRLLILLEIW